ncbi:amino acid-binding protein [Candidatus Sumerlaeota bacterium]|nr:amino acid-binding protein [Candidatus Sumerlaeota bacterium]
MNYTAERVDVWAASINDEPGALSKLLAGLEEAGANLECVIARRSPGKSGSGDVFLTPLRGYAQVAAAAELGVKATSSVFTVRVEGMNAPGVGAALTAKLAETGINLHGLSAAVIGMKFVLYLGLDSEADADKAITILRQDD